MERHWNQRPVKRVAKGEEKVEVDRKNGCPRDSDMEIKDGS